MVGRGGGEQTISSYRSSNHCRSTVYLLYLQLPAIEDRNRQQTKIYKTTSYIRMVEQKSGVYFCIIMLLGSFYNWMQRKVVCIGITRQSNCAHGENQNAVFSLYPGKAKLLVVILCHILARFLYSSPHGISDPILPSHTHTRFAHPHPLGKTPYQLIQIPVTDLHIPLVIVKTLCKALRIGLTRRCPPRRVARALYLNRFSRDGRSLGR